MRAAVLLLYLATLLSTSHARFNPIQLLRPPLSTAEITSCPSWRLTVETHNRQGKKLVPQACVEYVQEYMLGGQYKADCEEMANVAIEYARSKTPAADGTDIWVFDIDETTLSNIAYYQDPEVQFGSLEPADRDKFFKWVELGKAAAMPGIQRLYNTTRSLGYNNVLLTGVWPDYAVARERNLKEVGFDNWMEIIYKFIFFNSIQLLRPLTTVTSGPSWHLTVETRNRKGKKLVPQACVEYVREYMLGGQYKADCDEMANVAIEYAKSKTPAADGKDIWIFDIDETALSNIDYYQDAEVQFGSLEPVDRDKFFKWVELGKAVAVPGIQHLYNTTRSLGYSNVLLTGVWDDYASAREKNLKEVGYDNWMKIIFKYVDTETNKFKSDERTRLVKAGYRIVGNVGDQWGDLTGENAGERTFKVPNPMYYS